MKKSVSEGQVVEKIIRFQKEVGGVFLTSDLYNLIGLKSPLADQRLLNRLVKDGFLNRVKRGLYVTREFDSFYLASRFVEPSYISLDTVLIANGLVGTLNPASIASVTMRPRFQHYAVYTQTFFYYSIDESLFFGFDKQQRGICWADNEKAFLDTLYFYLQGTRFLFDPKNEVRIDMLDLKKLKFYLSKYKNPKFRKFVEGVVCG